MHTNYLLLSSRFIAIEGDTTMRNSVRILHEFNTTQNDTHSLSSVPLTSMNFKFVLILLLIVNLFKILSSQPE